MPQNGRSPDRFPGVLGRTAHWPPRAPRRRTPTSSLQRAGESRSRRFMSRSRSRTCWICRLSNSTGSSATRYGSRTSRRPLPKGAPTSTRSPGWRRSSRRFRPSRTTRRRCRCHSVTTASKIPSTPSTSARIATARTPRRCSSRPSSPTTRPARSSRRPSSSVISHS